MRACLFILAAACLGDSLLVSATEQVDDPLAPWRSGVKIQAVSSVEGRHTIHAYFNTCPESPDQRWVLFYASTAPDAQQGSVMVRDRHTGEERVLVRDIRVEDAHRAACQQWVSNGRHVVYHGEREGRWFVGVVEVATGAERVLARDRLAGWGQPSGDTVPLYGLHWNPGAHRDLEFADVATGAIRTAVTADEVQAAYPDWMRKHFAGKPTSIFFPVVSPDSQRVFFKMAAPAGGDPRSSKASQREGLVCYDLAARRFLFLREQWGHPSWHPDKQTIVEKGNQLIDGTTGKARRIPGLPAFRGDHPSASPDGRLLVTDTTLEKFGGTANEWAIALADARGTNHVLLHRFDNSRGARSWRRSHPHPFFSPDGRRIYFNVSSGPWTQLHVAELANPANLKKPAGQPGQIPGANTQ